MIVKQIKITQFRGIIVKVVRMLFPHTMFFFADISFQVTFFISLDS